MGDTKKGREKQASDEAKRQRKRDLEEALARGEEVEPERDDADDQLGEFDEALETHDYPTTTHELIESYGDQKVESQEGMRSIADVLEPIDDETYDSADGVRRRVLSQLRR